MFVGRKAVKVVPSPSLLVTVMLPHAASGILYGDAEPLCISLGYAYCYLAACRRELEGIAEQIV